jgi:hypothetical protein
MSDGSLLIASSTDRATGLPVSGARPETETRSQAAPASIEGVLVFGLAVAAWMVHQPGVFATDSLISWYEGTTGRFTSNQQPLLGVLWALLDRTGNGASALVFLSCLMFTSAAYLILRSFAGALAAWSATALILVFPPVFAQLSVINKETIGGNALLLSVALLMLRVEGRERGALSVLAGALAAVSVLIRYQFVVAIGAVVIVVAVQEVWRGQDRAGVVRRFFMLPLRFGLSFSAALILIILCISRTQSVDWAAPFESNYRLQLQFELAALIASRPDIPLDVLAESGADAQAIGSYAALHYDPNTNVSVFPMAPLLKNVPNPALARQISALSEAQPGRLSQHHWQTFISLLGLQDVCWPVQKKILRPVADSEQGDMAAKVGLSRLEPSISTTVFESRLFPANTVLFRPVVYLFPSICLLLAAIGGRTLRPFGIPLILPASAVVYELSFAPIAAACDFRYSYWLVIAATISTTSLALRLLQRRPTKAVSAFLARSAGRRAARASG